MASDPYVLIRQKLDGIIAEAKDYASQQNNRYYEQVKTAMLSPEQQIIEYSKKKETIDLAINSLENKEYYRLAKHEHLISILYFSRTICLGRDDKKPVRDGVILYEEEQYIDRLLQNAKNRSKPLTYTDYLAGKENVCLYKLDERPPGTSDEDYDRIRAWQTEQKVNCTKQEFDKFRDNFKNKVKDESCIKDSIQSEIKLVENIFRNATAWTASQLISEFQKLKGMAGILNPEDEKDFHQLFVLFLKGNNLAFRLSPHYFETTTKNIESGSISGMPVFGFSLAMYCRWLHHIARFKKDVFDEVESSFDELFTQPFNEGISKKELYINRFKKKCDGKSFKDRHYQAILLQEMEKQRKIFNQMEFSHYLNLLERYEELKYRFIDDCLRCLNVELPKEELRLTHMLNENIVFFNEELCLLKHNPLMLPAKQLEEDAILLDILCHMSSDTELINSFLDSQDLIKVQISNDSIPLYFINENAIELYSSFFQKAIRKFKKLIEKINVVEKGCFIAEFLRDINYLVTSQGINCKNKNSICRMFILILKDELSTAERIYNFKKTDSDEKKNDKETSEKKPISFDYRLGPRPLDPIMTAMDMEFDLFGEGTTVDDFMEVVMCKDLSKIKKIIHLSAKYNILKALIKRLLPWCPNLKPAVMEQSGIFMMVNEGPLKAKSLYKATSLLKEVEDKMDSIFKAKYR